MDEDKLLAAWQELMDSVLQHPSTKPYKPLTNREMQLQTELQRIRAQVRQCIILLKLMLDDDTDDETLF
jgi:hypothetical protein